jgi:spermidine/putrescine-binding protein
VDSTLPPEQRLYDPFNTFSLPAARGAIGINARGAPLPTSWAEFFELARTELTHLPPAKSLNAALKSLGHSINTRNTFARADAQSLVSNLQSHPLEHTTLALSHPLGDGWTFTLPAEGAESWEDCFCIPTDSPHPDLAHAFIQFALAAQPLAPLPPGSLEPLSPFASA